MNATNNMIIGTNNISSDQSDPSCVSLIRARYNIYGPAKLLQGGFVITSICLPLANTIFGTCAETKSYIALASLILLFLDIAVFDKFQKDRIKKGAKLQEEFDTKVLGLPWNPFVVGDKVTPEDIRRFSAKKLSDSREEEISSWYESCVSEVPLHIGRLICQRTNLHYDQRLRRRYGNLLLLIAIVLGVVLLVTSIAINLKMTDFILLFFVPFTPVFAWALREHRKQFDTALVLEKLQSEFKRIWRDALHCDSQQQVDINSRQLQDAIYQHRANSPLVFDWIYRCMRKISEDEAGHAAKELVTEAKSALEKRLAQ